MSALLPQMEAFGCLLQLDDSEKKCYAGHTNQVHNSLPGSNALSNLADCRHQPPFYIATIASVPTCCVVVGSNKPQCQLSFSHNLAFGLPGKNSQCGLQAHCKARLFQLWSLPQLLEMPVACPYSHPQLWPPLATAKPHHPLSSSCCCLPVRCLFPVPLLCLSPVTQTVGALHLDHMLLPLLELRLLLAVPCWSCWELWQAAPQLWERLI